MSKRLGTVLHAAVLAGLAFGGLAAAAEPAEVKEKPAMYTYEASWTIPRARWADMEKQQADTKVMDKLVASGTLIAYGDDETIVHQEEGSTHDSWWSATSLAGVLNALDEIGKAPAPASNTFLAATKHSDEIFVSRYYNWKPGSWKRAYQWTGYYTLKADAPDDAVATLAKEIVGPTLEKMLADGVIVEWEVDVPVVHTSAPGSFSVTYVSPTAEGIDKVRAEMRARGHQHPLDGMAYDSVTDFKLHRDALTRSTLTFK